MTYLSVKALRHYHDVGLLEPAAVDPDSGYRRYAAGQVATAQAIRRLRDLDMPIDDVRAVLAAPDVEGRNAAILAHLRRMQAQLERTEDAVSSLRSLLEDELPAGALELRSVPATHALAITGDVRMDECGDWLGGVYDELHAAAGDDVSGHDGALYFDDFFEESTGRVVAYVPVATEPLPLGRARPYVVPAASLAVMVHEGPFAELDRTYGALGTVVATRGIGAGGPIREHYLADDLAEVCWPVTTGGTTT